MSASPELKLELFRSMLRIRLVERRIEDEYHKDEMKTPVHLCIGQEAVAVGVCAALRQDDYVQSNHRSHGHYLAKGGDLRSFIAELYCRSTGCSKGFGGSMHLVDTRVGHMGSSSIVGGGIPIATGLALSARLLGQSKVAAVFFGDGAADEGTLYESVNFAVLRSLPVLYLYENNQLSVCSRVTQRQKLDCAFHFVPQDQLRSAKVDGNDVLAVYEAASAFIEQARIGRGPTFLECVTYRMRGHAGAGHDAALGYRTLEEIEQWEARDPITTFSAKLRAEGLVDDPRLAQMTREIEAEIDDAFEYAKQSPLPGADDLHRYLYRE